ncbi:MAG: hypothetical protein WCA35_11185, partial [Kovacikia sp.]
MNSNIKVNQASKSSVFPWVAAMVFTPGLVLGLFDPPVLAETIPKENANSTPMDQMTPVDQGAPASAQVDLGADQVSFTGMDQVTSVSQLTDVKPTDWAFQALQSLVERYGCIVGYP